MIPQVYELNVVLRGVAIARFHLAALPVALNFPFQTLAPCHQKDTHHFEVTIHTHLNHRAY
ncbi:hypothetical protein [Chroogloeocystis siderophila]